MEHKNGYSLQLFLFIERTLKALCFGGSLKLVPYFFDGDVLAVLEFQNAAGAFALLLGVACREALVLSPDPD